MKMIKPTSVNASPSKAGSSTNGIANTADRKGETELEKVSKVFKNALHKPL